MFDDMLRHQTCPFLNKRTLFYLERIFIAIFINVPLPKLFRAQKYKTSMMSMHLRILITHKCTVITVKIIEALTYMDIFGRRMEIGGYFKNTIY